MQHVLKKKSFPIDKEIVCVLKITIFFLTSLGKI